MANKRWKKWAHFDEKILAQGTKTSSNGFKKSDTKPPNIGLLQHADNFEN